MCIIGVKRRGVELAHILADNIYSIEGVRLPVGVLDITLYRDDLSEISADPVIHPTDIHFNITDMNVILVDDVIYTGRTVRAGLDALMHFGRPATVQLAVLIDRGHRELPFRADYVGKNVPTALHERVEVQLEEIDGATQVLLCEREG